MPFREFVLRIINNASHSICGWRFSFLFWTGHFLKIWICQLINFRPQLMFFLWVCSCGILWKKRNTSPHTYAHIHDTEAVSYCCFFLLSEYQIEMNVLKIFRYQEYSQYTTVCDNTFALLRTIYINKHEKIDILFCCCEFSVTLSFLNWHI